MTMTMICVFEIVTHTQQQTDRMKTDSSQAESASGTQQIPGE